MRIPGTLAQPRTLVRYCCAPTNPKTTRYRYPQIPAVWAALISVLRRPMRPPMR